MSKELTEKWKNGELDERYRYYFRFPKGRAVIRAINSVNNNKKMKDWDKIECLDRVPQYDEYLKLLNDSLKLQRLQEQLERAKKALREAGEMALSNETDISKIHDIVHPVIVYLNGGVK